jgi:hypothetical protein
MLRFALHLAATMTALLVVLAAANIAALTWIAPLLPAVPKQAIVAATTVLVAALAGLAEYLVTRRAATR